ncbi:MAG: CBS domain-containing protein [Candidatus Cloacimonetes bacterium]|nr:CBS domain-containing protein [Candidatus Cloacimonadota bacterium]
MKLLVSHSSCDFDAFASMIACNVLFPDAKMCLVGDIDESVKKFLKDYQYKFSFLKEKSINFDDIESVIIVDNCRFDRLNKIGKFLAENKHIPIICFDHHPIEKKPENFLFYHYDKVGSCVTLLLRFIHERSLTIDPFTATIMSMGIYEDTGNFTNASTTSADFSAMAYLLSLGASLKTIKKYINHSFNSTQLKLMNRLLNSLETHIINGIEIFFFSINLNAQRHNISSLIQHIRQSEHIACLFCFVISKNKLTIIARSDYDFVPVDEVLLAFGGGGHPSSASVTLSDVVVEDIQKHIIKLLKFWIEKHGTVKDIMSKNLITVSEKTDLQTAMKILLSNNVGALVIENNNEIIGLITKKDITKLFLHKLSKVTVDKFMTPEPITVNPDMSIFVASQLMLDHDIGRLPVVSKNKLVGIISRRDILKAKQFTSKSTSFLESNFENVNSMLNDLTSDVVKNLIEKISLLSDSLKIKTYLIGGFVRDLLMGKKNIDIDIVVEGDAIKFAEAFKEKFGNNYTAFSKFQTAIIEYPQIKKIDVASARSEVYHKPGNLPDVEASTIRNDMYRRDFTINSIAIQLNQNNKGLLIDYFHGRRDIQLGIVRVLHNLSFIDDPTRILRAVRFEQRFNFKLENKTLHLLRNSLELDSLSTVAVERLQQELIHSCNETVPQKFFYRLYELGILRKLNSNLSFDFQKSEYFEEIYNSIIWFNQSFVNESINKWVVYHLALTYDLSLRTKLKFVEQYKYPLILKKCMYEYHNFVEKDIFKIELLIRPGLISEVLESYNIETLLFLSVIKKTGHIPEKIIKYLLNWRFVKPKLNGYDLIKLGVKPGSYMGNLLKELKINKIDGNLNSKDEELEYVKDKLQENLI